MATIHTDLIKARHLLIEGDIVAIPTETVYGLAGNAYNEQAVEKIFAIKNRPYFDPLIVHANAIAQVKAFTHPWPKLAYKLARHFWPGPLTLLLPKTDQIPDLVTAGSTNVAVRIPAHTRTLTLLTSLPFPLAAPSANPFGYISPTTAEHVQAQLGDQIPYILADDPCILGLESTIVGFENNHPIIYRLGSITVSTIEAILGCSVSLAPQINSHPQAPGELMSHYAPRTKLKLGPIDALIQQYADTSLGILTFDRYYPGIDQQYQVKLAPKTGSLEEAASNLFAALRQLDQMPIDVILGNYVGDYGIGQTINDRLKKAAAKWC